eukprot:3828917-Amphidinium_carterae.1
MLFNQALAHICAAMKTPVRPYPRGLELSSRGFINSHAAAIPSRRPIPPVQCTSTDGMLLRQTQDPMLMLTAQRCEENSQNPQETKI